MAEIRKLDGEIGFKKSNIIIKTPVAPFEVDLSNDLQHQCDETTLNCQSQVASNNKSNSTSNKMNDIKNSRQVKRYYIDELGFYRHLDLEQKQYVCSNLNAANLRQENSSTSNCNNRNINNNLIHNGDGGYEITIRAIRNDLGISHFDRTVGYEQWKRSWDDFMRAKLIKQEPVTLNNELKRRVRSGIPHDYRCKVWCALIRMRTKSLRAQAGEDIYNEIIHKLVSKVEISSPRNDNSKNLLKNNSSTNRSSYLAPIKVGGLVNSQQSHEPQTNGRFSISKIQEQALEKCFKQIELDLLRTLPNNRHFEDPNSIGIQRVRRVLRAYACFNAEVGYCQGMNRLAAMALLVLPEEEAFWCLVAIIQCIMPKDYYLKPWLAQVDCYVLNDLIEKKMPRLHKHLTKNDIQLTLFTWFFTIFVDGFRPELMLRIWDCFLLEGDKVLFRFALSILYIYQEDILGMNDFSTISTHLSHLVSTRRLDVEHLFESKYSISMFMKSCCSFQSRSILTHGLSTSY